MRGWGARGHPAPIAPRAHSLGSGQVGHLRHVPCGLRSAVSPSRRRQRSQRSTRSQSQQRQHQCTGPESRPSGSFGTEGPRRTFLIPPYSSRREDVKSRQAARCLARWFPRPLPVDSNLVSSLRVIPCSSRVGHDSEGIIEDPSGPQTDPHLRNGRLEGAASFDSFKGEPVQAAR